MPDHTEQSAVDALRQYDREIRDALADKFKAAYITATGGRTHTERSDWYPEADDMLAFLAEHTRNAVDAALADARRDHHVWFNENSRAQAALARVRQQLVEPYDRLQVEDPITGVVEGVDVVTVTAIQRALDGGTDAH